MRFALLHSPLTSALIWRGVADALARRGRSAFCIKLPEPQHLHPPYWLVHAATAAEALPEEGSVTLVAHSGAGVLLPAIARFAANRERSAHVERLVFVDCDLPRDGCSRFDLMTPDDAARMKAQCKDGWMLRWTDVALEPVIPDRTMRAAFVAELPQVPSAMYEEAIAVPDGWSATPVSYLSLSRFYPEAVRAAEQNGWGVRKVEGANHLTPYTDPERIATELETLVRTE